MNASSRTISSAPPPFYWKVPVPEKNYMSENYKRIRQIANQTQRKQSGSGPLKAAFIPGVTRNEKYAHVTSRVGEFLKNKKETPETRDDFAFQNVRQQQSRSSIVKTQPINRRLSKSSTDLRPNTFAQTTSAPNGRPNHVFANTSSNAGSNVLQARQRRGSGESFGRHQESVYNWHFKDDVVNEFPTGATRSNGSVSSSIPTKYCHRVEYLPCDGICAEENFIVDEAPPDSGRSASSSRTSRGCNTEETRILEDPVKNFELGRQVEGVNSFENTVVNEVPERTNASLPKSRSVFTLHSNDNDRKEKSSTTEWFPQPSIQPNENDLGSRFNSLRVTGSNTQQKPENSRLKGSLSATSLKNVKHFNGNGGGGDMPHTLGVVPKYLKQRQEEWKMQEKERKEAELTANVPPGYVLLSNEERLEHLKTFKHNYDSLINELNRIPIRIDTIRVREHKIHLEQQLTRLEEAMKTFSRSRVWIKVEG